MPSSSQVFLTAEWRDLVMLNYEVDPHVLARFVPRGLLLDTYEGKTFISLVAFRFSRTRLFGHLSIPFHADFVEVNLRLYVRRDEGGELRRGVVFIAELVPKRAIAITARLVYGENYKCASMMHHIQATEVNKTLEFEWKIRGRRFRTAGQTRGTAHLPQCGTLEQFVTEHYWGYAKQRSGGCIEYRVSHAPWRVWMADNARFEGDATDLFGPELAAILHQAPNSAFAADGSPVTVLKGRKIS
jgi:uncharacterized protein